jgi:glycosyltransferase involved in cell wall biosynthesis
VHFLGNVPHADIPLYIRACDAFVLNSEYEGLSHTLLEVIHLGAPIICTGVCGNPELVEDGVNGLLVRPRDDRGLAAAIGRLLDEPELARRFVEASARRAPTFTREATFPQVEELLESVARR